MIFTTLATLLLPSLAQGRHTLKTEPVEKEPVEAQFQVLVSGYNRARDRSSATTDRPLSLKLYDVDVEGRVYDAGAHVLEPGEDNLTYMEIVNGDTIYAVHEVDSHMHATERLSRWTLSQDGMQKHEFVKTRKRPVSLSVSVELGVVFVANYGNNDTETREARSGAPDPGSVQVFALDAEGVIVDLVYEEVYGGSECFGHATDVVHKGNNFYVAERGCDRIHHYTVHDDGEVNTRPMLQLGGGGFAPRKITMHPTEDLAFVVTELRHPDEHLRRMDSLEVYAVNPEDGEWSFNQRLFLDETEAERSGAEVVVHPNGKYFYVSTSRSNKTGVLDVYELPPDTFEVPLSSIQRYELVGTSPRGLALSPDGSFMVVADEDSAVVQFVNVDPETGMLTTKRIYNTPETMPQTPTFVGFYSAPDFQPSTTSGEPSDESESEFPERMGQDWDYLMERVEDINVKLSGYIGQNVGDIGSRMRTFGQEWDVFKAQFAGLGGSLTQSMAEQTRLGDDQKAARNDLAMQLSNMERSIEEQKKTAAEQNTQSAQLSQGMDLLTEHVSELHTLLEEMKDTSTAAESHLLPDGESTFWKLHQYHQGLQAEASKRRQAEDDSVKKNYAIIALSMTLALFCWFAVVAYCFQKTLIRTKMQEAKIERMAHEIRAAEMAGISIKDPLEGTPGKEITVSSPKEQQAEKPAENQAKSTNGATGEMLPPQPEFLTQGSKGSAFV